MFPIFQKFGKLSPHARCAFMLKVHACANTLEIEYRRYHLPSASAIAFNSVRQNEGRFRLGSCYSDHRLVRWSDLICGIDGTTWKWQSKWTTSRHMRGVPARRGRWFLHPVDGPMPYTRQRHMFIWRQLGIWHRPNRSADQALGGRSSKFDFFWRVSVFSDS